jgi:hypothetical protein
MLNNRLVKSSVPKSKEVKAEVKDNGGLYLIGIVSKGNASLIGAKPRYFLKARTVGDRIRDLASTEQVSRAMQFSFDDGMKFMAVIRDTYRSGTHIPDLVPIEVAFKPKCCPLCKQAIK